MLADWLDGWMERSAGVYPSWWGAQATGRRGWERKGWDGGIAQRQHPTSLPRLQVSKGIDRVWAGGRKESEVGAVVVSRAPS